MRPRAEVRRARRENPGPFPAGAQPMSRATVLQLGMVEGHRYFDCSNYDGCVEGAVLRKWESFSCRGCPFWPDASVEEKAVEAASPSLKSIPIDTRSSGVEYPGDGASISCAVERRIASDTVRGVQPGKKAISFVRRTCGCSDCRVRRGARAAGAR